MADSSYAPQSVGHVTCIFVSVYGDDCVCRSVLYPFKNIHSNVTVLAYLNPLSHISKFVKVFFSHHDININI